MTTPKQRRSEATIATVVAAATELFGRHGFAAVSLDAVAARCGRTKGAIYHHFATKDELFEDVFRREQRRLADRVVAGLPSDPVESLTAGIAHYLSLIATDPPAARITLLDAPGVLGWVRWRRCDDGPFRELLAGALHAIDAADRLRPDVDASVLVDVVLGAVTEAALVVATAAEPAAVAARLDAGCRALVEGLAGPPPSGRGTARQKTKQRSRSVPIA